MASQPDHEKPLPTLPKKYDAPKLTTLSLEARNHTRRFILRALEEEQSTIAGNDWDHENETWANAILDGLDSLGDGIAHGGWIVGVNRSRRASIQRKLTLRDIKDGTTTTGAVAEPKSVALPDVPEHPADPPPPKPSVDAAMEQISLWISKPLPPSPKPYPKHILLTIASYGHVPDSVSDFEFIPSAVGCVFSPSRFMLPNAASSSVQASRQEGIILYGLDEWDSQFSSRQFESPVRSHCLAL
jgi:hypothetical protein